MFEMTTAWLIFPVINSILDIFIIVILYLAIKGRANVTKLVMENAENLNKITEMMGQHFQDDLVADEKTIALLQELVKNKKKTK